MIRCLGFELLLLLVVTPCMSFGSIAGEWSVIIGSNESQFVYVTEREFTPLNLTFSNVDLSGDEDFYFDVMVEKPFKAIVPDKVEKDVLLANGNGSKTVVVQLHALHVGYSQLYVVLRSGSGVLKERSREEKTLVIYKKDRTSYDTINSYMSFILTLVMLVNVGSILDKSQFNTSLDKCFELCLSLCGRFVVMPCLAVLIGLVCFPQNPQVQETFLFTSLAPSAGFVLLCIVLMKGNLSLTIIMIIVNFLATLFIWPLWIHELSRLVYKDGSLMVPFGELGLQVSIVVGTLCCGIFLRLKSRHFFYAFLIFYLVWGLCFLAYTLISSNYFFEELTPMICLGAFALTSSGYLVIWLLGKLCRFSDLNAFSIAVTSSFINMTLPTALIRDNFEEPRSDILSIIPMMCGFMSIGWAVVFYVCRRIFCIGAEQMKDEDSFDVNAIGIDSIPMV